PPGRAARGHLRAAGQERGQRDHLLPAAARPGRRARHADRSLIQDANLGGTMTTIADQVHGKFKVFSGKLASDQTLGSLGASVEGWVKAAKVAPKSIGVEYIEHSGSLLLSIGYRDDEPAYPVKLATVRIGKIEATDAAGLAQIENAMAKASQS